MDIHSQTVAWFITPHGFGHAARSTAAMLALEKLVPVHFHIFTRVPEWFFRESHLVNFTYHDCLTDIGLVQKTSLDEDLPATIRRLSGFYPIDPGLISQLSKEISVLGCRCIVCDIAPMGLAVAEESGLPSILIENFTWDWIYAGYSTESGFDKYIKILSEWFSRATDHIQTQPVCAPGLPKLTTSPVSRPVLTPRNKIRQQLDIPQDSSAVLITMGGIETAFDYLLSLEHWDEYYFIIPGGSDRAIFKQNLRLLPHHSGFYHPDLVAASDAIIGKLGYSTLSEASTAGIPYGFIPRNSFRESVPLTAYVAQNMSGLEISETDYARGSWLHRLPDLLSQPTKDPPRVNGADQIAHWLLRYLL